MTRTTHRIRFGLAAVLVTALSGIAAATPARTTRVWSPRAELKAKFDRNDDGTLGTAERAAARRYRIDRLIADLDGNRDGMLSYAEVRTRGAEASLVVHFRGIDKNDDWKLSRFELYASPHVQGLIPARHTWWWYYWSRKAPA